MLNTYASFIWYFIIIIFFIIMSKARESNVFFSISRRVWKRVYQAHAATIYHTDIVIKHYFRVKSPGTNGVVCNWKLSETIL